MTARYSLDLDAPPGSRTDLARSYSLSFIEYGGTPADRLEERQWAALQRILATNKKKYVVVFIHGWHHNANIGDRDVQRMHVFLSYARSFLNQRASYRGAELIGVYIGWNASVWRQGYLSPLDHLSYRAKKSESDRIAKKVVSDLSEISALLDIQPGNPAADKMLVVGHSFGGNILAAGLKNDILQDLQGYNGGTPLAPPLGDMVVMLNPASEARNLIDIQKLVRQRRLKFPINQAPHWMALTSTDDWNAEEYCAKTSENKEGRSEKRLLPEECLEESEAKWDTATGNAFNYGQVLLNGNGSKEDYTALGHFLPTREYPYGTTHDLTAIEGAKFRTEYWNGIKADRSVCDTAQEWLPELRRALNNWDTFYASEPRPTKFARSASMETEYQLRAYLYRRSIKATYSARYNNEPYWNVRTLPNLITDHSGFMSYMLMCMLNQFVLDDPAGTYPVR
ncbi:hypothetical protein DMY87_08505 [Rhizobium wuzhouense]|uniref:Alpha/beta hydrolase n=2 Tax=Rhizobium wuzhouense TaxID=1986026 RepID=A0ABX5NTY2_9HYPH|nr:hypothetical protein DMY87_08505 [Rhizobium wuzhouense]